MDRGDGGLQFIGSQRVGHNLTTKKQQQQTCIFCSCRYFDVLSFSELFIFLVSCVNSWVSHTKLWDGYQICLVTSLRADLISVWVCVRARSYVLTLCDPMDCSSPGSFVHGILQARILEWVAIAFSRGSSQPRGRTRVSCVSCIGRPILYHCTTWEALKFCNSLPWRSF